MCSGDMNADAALERMRERDQQTDGWGAPAGVRRTLPTGGTVNRGPGDVPAADLERAALNERRLRERRVFADLAVRLDARVRRLELALRQAQHDIHDVLVAGFDSERLRLATAAFNRITDALSPDETAAEREAEGEGGDDG